MRNSFARITRLAPLLLIVAGCLAGDGAMTAPVPLRATRGLAASGTAPCNGRVAQRADSARAAVQPSGTICFRDGGTPPPPLLVVNGVPVGHGFPTDLDPDDIESIEVLKSSAAASIYGDNRCGAILITTRKKSPPKSP